jgi:hypothetical protein
MPPSVPRSCLAELIDVEMFLQSPAPRHWVARRKAAVVLAVRMKLISLSDACVRYRLSVDEFAIWEAAFDSHGIAGLLEKRRIRKSREAVELPDVISEPRWPQYP